MTGLDTNVLVRFLVQDDPEQARKATRFIEEKCSADAPGFINRIVLCEMIWVLESAYRFPRQSVANALEKILRARQLRVEDPQGTWTSLRAYQNGADFADSLIASINLRLGCDRTITFDRGAARRMGLESL